MYNQNTTALMEQETFVLPAMAESEFSSAELAEDMDGTVKFIYKTGAVNAG